MEIPDHDASITCNVGWSMQMTGQGVCSRARLVPSTRFRKFGIYQQLQLIRLANLFRGEENVKIPSLWLLMLVG